MTDYVRGSMVFFDTAFVDKAGAPASPDTAVLHLVFRDSEHDEQRTTV